MRRLLPLLLLSALMAACSVTPPAPVSDLRSQALWQQRQHDLQSISQWKLRGRVAVNNGVEAWHLNMVWTQSGEDYQIFLHGPFGAGKVKLQGNAYGVELRNSDNQTFYADTPDELLYQQTGVKMPVNSLRYWVRGLPTPVQEKQPTLDARGRLAKLMQQRWQVEYARYIAVSGMDLPKKVFIDKPEDEINVKVVIDRWQLGAF